MKVYAILEEDRHYDVQVHLRIDRDKAYKFARELAKENLGKRDWELEEIAIDNETGLLHIITYSCEDDCVSIHLIEL